jgi:nitroreductase
MLMENRKELEFIYRRRSVRKFLATPVPNEIVNTLIDAAIHAPSGKNAQNWHFVVVRNAKMIEDMAAIVEKKHEILLPFIADEQRKNDFKKSVGYHTVFGMRGSRSGFCGRLSGPGRRYGSWPRLTQSEIDSLRRANPGIQMWLPLCKICIWPQLPSAMELAG